MTEQSRITVATFTDRGGREVNEDSVGAWIRDNTAFLAVADGLGGCGNGEVASGIAIACMKEAYDASMLFDEDRLESTIREANGRILRQQTQYKRMKSTITALWIYGNRALASHVGDTRIYQFRQGSVYYQSEDHSMSQLAVKLGEITPSQIRGHEERNVLLRALGADSGDKMDTDSLDVCRGDGFLLCSDGFWELILEEEMIDALNGADNADQWLERMVKIVEARRDYQSDNNTAAVAIVG